MTRVCDSNPPTWTWPACFATRAFSRCAQTMPLWKRQDMLFPSVAAVLPLFSGGVGGGEGYVGSKGFFWGGEGRLEATGHVDLGLQRWGGGPPKGPGPLHAVPFPLPFKAIQGLARYCIVWLPPFGGWVVPTAVFMGQLPSVTSPLLSSDRHRCMFCPEWPICLPHARGVWECPHNDPIPRASSGFAHPSVREAN